jgi:hypothetical protein
VARLSRGLSRDSWQGPCAAYGRALREVWLPASRVTWVPAHGRHVSWVPPPGWPSPLRLRRLNAEADGHCSAVLLPERPAWDRAKLQWQLAARWSTEALVAQLCTTGPFFEKCKSIWGAEPQAGDSVRNPGRGEAPCPP